MDSRRSRQKRTRDEVRYRYKFVDASRRRHPKVAAKWQSDGWELYSQSQVGRRFEMTFRRAKPNRRWPTWAARIGLNLCLAVALLLVLAPLPVVNDPLASVRADAAVAVRALENGDLVALDEQLAAYRGQPDFAYFFASRTTPRVLGDALATVAGKSENESLKEGVNPHAYDLALTDLAGTVALATYGTRDRALPDSWTNDFIAATTTPESLGDKTLDEGDESAKQRADQDVANKQNLLLLLSRGYWSTGFLEKVTDAYWQFDRDEGTGAWPGPSEEGKYAPAPNGRYLTDGIVALTAALTANPAASKWAFADFQTGTKKIEGSDYEVGTFTHYLLFDHQFPESDGESIGMTTVLTALSSAIEAVHGSEPQTSSNDSGPARDWKVLQSIADDANDVDDDDDSGCSWNPLDYGHCVKAATESIWHGVRRWGHPVLTFLSLGSSGPGYVRVIGISAAAINTIWYALEGDFQEAGVSLAIALSGLAIAKAVKVIRAGRTAKQTTQNSDELADATKKLKGGERIAKDRELALAGASKTMKSPRKGYDKEKDAENDYARTIPGSSQQKTMNPRCSTTCQGQRKVDIYDAKTGTCIEVKQGIGTTNFKKADQYQVFKDVLLLKNKDCRKVEYHFFPDASGRVGPHGELRELLQKHGIRYVMHLPKV